MTPPQRTGRRSGRTETRERILEEARDLFSSKGFERTSLRAIASAADVDVALIGHYFGNKRGLVLEAMRLPVDPETVLAPLASTPDDRLGATLLGLILAAWDSPVGPAAVATFRSAIGGEDDLLIKDFMLGVALAPLRARVEEVAGDAHVRLQLAAAQIAGLMVARKILALEPLASMPIDDVVVMVAPTIQRYLTGDLSGSATPIRQTERMAQASDPTAQHPSSPLWVEHAIWWHVYPLGALGADTTGADRTCHRPLTDLIPWLDYIVELGANGLALGPIFAAATHGYDTTDYFRIDERLGSEADFDALIAACHERGLKVMLDGVFNHVGHEHPAFAALTQKGPMASTAGWFDLQWPDGWTPGNEPGYRNFEGHDALVALDHSSGAVRDLVRDVLLHWSSRGADAWRLDAAYAVPSTFWAGVLPSLREQHPDTYVVGEVIHGDYPQIVHESGMDAVTQYELWKAIWSSFNDRNLFELDHAMSRHEAMATEFVPWTFIGNHDVTRIATQLTTPEHLPLALVILLTVPGTPAIYAGDEQAFQGTKHERVGGDDEIRPELPATPEDLSPFGGETYRLHQELTALRRRYPWLNRARVEQQHLSNEQLVYVCSGDDTRLVVALNLAEDEAAVPAAGACDVLAGPGIIEDEQIRLAAHGWAILTATRPAE